MFLDLRFSTYVLTYLKVYQTTFDCDLKFYIRRSMNREGVNIFLIKMSPSFLFQPKKEKTLYAVSKTLEVYEYKSENKKKNVRNERGMTVIGDSTVQLPRPHRQIICYSSGVVVVPRPAANRGVHGDNRDIICGHVFDSDQLRIIVPRGGGQLELQLYFNSVPTLTY